MDKKNYLIKLLIRIKLLNMDHIWKKKNISLKCAFFCNDQGNNAKCFMLSQSVETEAQKIFFTRALKILQERQKPQRGIIKQT